MIDNFAPQPYPLEASAEPGTWMLVVGWQRTGDGRLDPVLVSADGPLMTVSFPAELRYRLADTRPTAGRAAPAVGLDRHTGTPRAQPTHRIAPT